MVNRTLYDFACEFCNCSFKAPNLPSRPRKYCSLQCAGKAKVIGKEEVKKRHAIYLKEKMENDPEFRKKRLDQKKNYYFANRDHFLKKGTEKRRTDQHKSYHREYCSTARYKEYKHKYDRKLRAKKKYGPFAEAHIALLDLDKEVKKKMTAYQIRIETGRYGRTQKEKRKYEKSKRSNA